MKPKPLTPDEAARLVGQFEDWLYEKMEERAIVKSGRRHGEFFARIEGDYKDAEGALPDTPNE